MPPSWRSRWAAVFPGLAPLLLAPASRTVWRGDCVAGLTVCAMAVPGVLANAQLAGLPPVAGLYATLAALVIYALVGTSRLMSVGTDSAASMLMATALLPLVASSAAPAVYVTWAAGLTLLVRLFTLAAGWARLGFLGDQFSRPVLYGYMAGVGFSIIASQLGHLLGFPLTTHHGLTQLDEVVHGLSRVQPATLGVSAAALAVLLFWPKLAPRVPAALVTLVAFTWASAWGRWEDRGIAVLGEIPRGLPTWAWPSLSLGDYGQLTTGALSLSFLLFVNSYLTASAFNSRLPPDQAREMNADGELRALGWMNLGAGLFQGMTVCGSNSRTGVNVSAGGTTQAAGWVAAAGIALVLWLLAPALRSLPLAVLGATLVVAGWNLVEWRELAALRATRSAELRLAVLTLGSVVLLGMVRGVLVAVAFSVADLLRRLARPHDAALSAEGLEGIDEAHVGLRTEMPPGIILYRFDAPLFFGNANHFLARAREVLALAHAPVRVLLLDAETIGSLDSTAVEALEQVRRELAARGAQLAIARAHSDMVKVLERTGLLERIGPERMFLTVARGVEALSEGVSGPPEEGGAEEGALRWRRAEVEEG